MGLKDTSFEEKSRNGLNSILHTRQGTTGPTTPDDTAGG
jgi:hypothetical protein